MIDMVMYLCHAHTPLISQFCLSFDLAANLGFPTNIAGVLVEESNILNKQSGDRWTQTTS